MDSFGNLQLLDVETGHCIKKLSGHTDCVNSLLFSSDGKMIVSTSEDKTICIWDVETGKKIHILKGHTGSVRYAEFSSNGENLVTVSWDYTIRIWDIKSGICLQVLKGHSEFNNIVAKYSSDGRHIVSASMDGTVKIWDYPPLLEIVDKTFKRFKHNLLTREEQRMYNLE